MLHVAVPVTLTVKQAPAARADTLCAQAHGQRNGGARVLNPFA